MRKSTGLRKPKNIRKAEWDSLPDYVKEKLLLRRRETEEKAALMGNPADFVKGIVAAEGGLPMDIVSLLAPGAGMSQAQRLTQMRPGGYPGYQEQEFVPEYKGTTLDLYSKMGGDPTSGAGLFGELMAPGAIIAAPIAAVRSISKGIKSLSKGNKALNRIFGAGDPIFANLGMEDTAQLLSGLKAEGQFGDIFIARDKLTGMINSTNPEKRIYNKQIREYSGFDKWLNDYKNKHAPKGSKKRYTTISLNDLEEFWAQQNLDLREAETKAFSNDWNPIPGGNNQKTFIMTYHGKNPPMSLETSNNLNQLSQNMHQKPFDELKPNEQAWVEKIYPSKYPEDTSAVFDIVPTPGDRLRNTEGEIIRDHMGREMVPTEGGERMGIAQGVRFAGEEISHFKEPNVIFHLRMDDRLGIGAQTGEKHLNVFELQSDWYARANKGGAWNFEILDSGIYELQRRNADLDQQIRGMRTPEGRSSEAKILEDELDDNFVEINELKVMRDKLEQKKVEFEELLSSEGRKGVTGSSKMPFIHPRQNEKWIELALKRVLKKAIDEGYDRVTLGSREIHQEIYGGLVRGIKEVKVRREPDTKIFDINRVEIDPIKGSPKNITTKVSGEKYPYYVEVYNDFNKIIKTNREGVSHYSDQNLNNIFGKELADLIRKKAKTNKKTIIKDFKPVDIGLEHIRLLYDNVIPNIIKGKKGSGIFKKLGLKVEKVPVGNNNPTLSVQAARNQGIIPPEFQDIITQNEAALHHNNFTTNYNDNGRTFATGEHFDDTLLGDLQDVYDSSAEFAIRLEDARLPGQETEEMQAVLEAMRQIEIHDRLPRDSHVDDGYKRLLHPETRGTEVDHSIDKLQQEYSIQVVRDPNHGGPPKFIEPSEEHVGVLQLTDQELYNQAWDADRIIEYNRLADEYHGVHEQNAVPTFEVNSLVKRVEIAGHPDVINARGVLDVLEEGWGTEYRLSEIPPYTRLIDEVPPEMLEFMPNPGTNFQEAARLENETFNFLPEPVKDDLRQVRSVELILKESYDIETFYPSMSEEPKFMFSEDVFGGPDQAQGLNLNEPVDRDTILEIANDVIAGPFVQTLDNQIGELMATHHHFRTEMLNFDFGNITPPRELKKQFLVNSIKLTDKNGNLLEKLKPFKEGGKFYYGALPPGILAGEAVRQQGQQQQSILE